MNTAAREQSSPSTITRLNCFDLYARFDGVRWPERRYSSLFRTTAFLLGAGASYGSRGCKPRPPPLGTQLFAALRARRGFFSTISGPLAAMFANNFEQAMGAMAHDNWQDLDPRRDALQSALMEMGQYFLEFEPTHESLYHDLASAAAAAAPHVVFASLNYDCLLEQALEQRRLRVVGDLTHVPGTVRVIKPHGASIAISNLRFVDVSFGPNMFDSTVRMLSMADARAYCAMRGQSMPPAISMYAHGKQPFAHNHYVNDQKRLWRELLVHADTLVVLGVRDSWASDPHIWEPIYYFTGEVCIVDPDPSNLRTVARRFRHAARVRAIRATFQEASQLLRSHIH